MHGAHMRIDGEHRGGALRRLAPVRAAEQILRDKLSGAVTIERRARGKSLRMQRIVYAAAKVAAQVRARRLRRLVESKALRGIKGRHHATQSAATRTVGTEFLGQHGVSVAGAG